MRVRENTKNVIFPIGKVPSENLPSLTRTLFWPLGGALWAHFSPKTLFGPLGGPPGPFLYTRTITLGHILRPIQPRC